MTSEVFFLQIGSLIYLSLGLVFPILNYTVYISGSEPMNHDVLIQMYVSLYI
jgi:hypothetical protein